MTTPPEKRQKEIHGVNVWQTKLQGNWYTTVDSRVKIAEQGNPNSVRRADAGYHVQSVAFVQIADRWAYHCLVEYPAGSGIVKPGTDFIDVKDASGVAKAETSAIGRALGLHGIAIEDSIASADEVANVLPQTRPSQDIPATPASPVSLNSVQQQIADTDAQRASRQDIIDLAGVLRANGHDTANKVISFFRDQMQMEVDPSQLKAGSTILTVGQCRRALELLNQQAEARDAKQDAKQDARQSVPAGSL